MAHPQQRDFCESVKKKYPQYFSGVFVLDVGSLDVNGNNHFLFDVNSLYLGLDVAPGNNVDIITPGHKLEMPDETFDVIISTECLEHDLHYSDTLRNICRLLRPGGLFVMTCATTGRAEHGTRRTTPEDAPLLMQINDEWANYYRNLTEDDFREAIDISAVFQFSEFTIENESHDLYFVGIKKGEFQKKNSLSVHMKSHPFKKHLQDIRDLEKTRNENSVLLQRLLALEDATFWKLTYPLRVLADLIPFRIRLILRKKLRVAWRVLKKSLLKLGEIKKYRLNHFESNSSIRDALKSIESISDISFPIASSPTVSIIIPVYNHLDYTVQCLKSLSVHQTRYTFEVIIVDDCSSDTTKKVLSQLKCIKYFKNKSNKGFIFSCNFGASVAKGEFLVFLNNDTVVLQGWLDELVQTFYDHKNVGLVGSKLLYPDGKLQEAGGIVWRDGTAWNYGRLQNPNKFEFNYVREVDYCSGASICIPKDIFIQAGCFDIRYMPAYFEDSDLAFTVRSLNYKVLYQPFSQVVHFEGITSGISTDSGTKKYQEINHPKFLEKWRHVLASKLMSDHCPITLARDGHVKQRVLMIDYRFPTPDKDAGSVTAYYFIRILQEIGYKITFYPDTNGYMNNYTDKLQRMGVECLYPPQVDSLEDYLIENGKYFDLVFICRMGVAKKYLGLTEKYCKNAKTIFDVADLHFIRELRQAEVENNFSLKKHALETKKDELSFIKKFNITIVHGEHEKMVLHEENIKENIINIPYFTERYHRVSSFQERKDICFLGGFLHSPNVDSVKYFMKEIWPLVLLKLPELHFYIVGSNPPKEIQSFASKNVTITGYTESLDEYFDHMRISIAPLRYGAGIKGKIISSLGYGVPCVATSIAAEGMGLTHGQTILLANDPNDFANQIVELYTNEQLWMQLSDAGLDVLKKEYSLESGKNRFMKALNGVLKTNIEVTEAQCL